jgi:hypothetical protein
MLTSMLLNELQKQHTELVAQQKVNVAQAREITEQRASTQQQIAELKATNQREAAKRVALEQRLDNLEHTIVAQHEGRKVEAAFNR